MQFKDLESRVHDKAQQLQELLREDRGAFNEVLKGLVRKKADEIKEKTDNFLTYARTKPASFTANVGIAIQLSGLAVLFPTVLVQPHVGGSNILDSITTGAYGTVIIGTTVWFSGALAKMKNRK